MYDVHSHILPGLDDGAKTVDEFVAMARAAAAGGTTVMLATPHRRDVTEDSSIAHLRELFANMVEELDAQGIGLSLTLGMENHLDEDLPEALARGAALPMNGTRYALVELPFFGHPDWVEPVLSDIQESGITPVLAHPERIELIQRDPDLLRDVRRAGDADPGDGRQRDRAVGRRGHAVHPRPAQAGPCPHPGLGYPRARRPAVADAPAGDGCGCGDRGRGEGPGDGARYAKSRHRRGRGTNV